MRLIQVRELAFYDPGPSARPCKSGPGVVAFAGCSSSVGSNRGEGSIFIVTVFKWMTNIFLDFAAAMLCSYIGLPIWPLRWPFSTLSRQLEMMRFMGKPVFFWCFRSS